MTRWYLRAPQGNIRVVVSYEVTRTTNNEYLPVVLAQTDYYPFGMIMDTMSDGTAGYRYGFNGKENDNDVKGTGNQQDYGFRIYDPRVARFLSVDPLAKDYPSWSSYPFAMNRCIDGVDLDGLEFYAANQISRDRIMNVISEQLGSTSGFSWAESDGRLVFNGSIPSVISPLKHDLYTGLLTVIRSEKPVIYVGDAVHTDNTRYPFQILGFNSGREFGASLIGFQEEAITITSPSLAVVFQDPVASAAGEFNTIHELLDHVVPWIESGYRSPDQPNSSNTSDLVKRHSDALNNIRIQGRRSGVLGHSKPNDVPNYTPVGPMPSSTRVSTPTPSTPASTGVGGSTRGQGGGNTNTNPTPP